MDSKQIKNKLIFFLIMMIASLGIVLGQTTQGIHFEQGLDWMQILAKAKVENRNVFVDCYATWCAPCKMMDEQVYATKKVGEYYNNHFICVKLQMDKTDHDDSLIMKWYSSADKFHSDYSVNAFPTFLFFAPNGAPLHKASGAMTETNFIQLGKNAENPEKQYYSILKRFQPGILDTSELKGLARSFKFTNKELAEKLALDYLNRIHVAEISNTDNVKFLADLSGTPAIKTIAINYLKNIPGNDYSNGMNYQLIRVLQKDSNVINQVVNYLATLPLNSFRNDAERELLLLFAKNKDAITVATNYLNTLSESEMLKKENLVFVAKFINTSKDKYFTFFYSNTKKIDKIVQTEGYSRRFVDAVIEKEDVLPYLTPFYINGNVPNWDSLEHIIRIKYNSSYAYRIILDKKQDYFLRKKDYDKWGLYLVKYFNLLGLKYLGEFNLNNYAYLVFLRCTNKHVLKKALAWSSYAVRHCPKDSYLGNLDTKATILYKLGRKKEALDLESQTPYPETLAGMKADLPIWKTSK